MKVKVSDGDLSDEEILIITVTEVNQPPVLAAVGDKQVSEGDLLRFTAAATDGDLPAQSLSFRLEPGPTGEVPANAVITSNGVFSWTPGETDGGKRYTFLVIVGDGSATDSEEITVAVDEANQAPVLAAIGNKAVGEGTLLAFTASATDGDLPASSLSYALAPVANASFPDGAVLNAMTGAFTWTPTKAQGPGSYSVRVVASDGTATDEETITITVSEANAPPQLSGVPATATLAEGQSYGFTAAATDNDLPAQNLSFSLAEPPKGPASVKPRACLAGRPPKDKAPARTLLP